MAVTTVTDYAGLSSWVSARNSQGSYTEDEWAELPSGTSISLTGSLDLNPVNAGAYVAGIRPQTGAEITGRLWYVSGTRPTLSIANGQTFTLRGKGRVLGLQLTRGAAGSGSYRVGGGGSIQRCILDSGSSTGVLLTDVTGGGSVYSSLFISSAVGNNLVNNSDAIYLRRCTLVANGRTGAALRSDYSTLRLNGCVLYGFASHITGAFEGGTSYNATSLGTTFGTNCQTSVTSADFVSVSSGSEDYTPAATSSKLLETGATISGATVDFYNVSIPQGALPDIGAVELPVAAPTGPTIDTDPTAQAADEGATATFTGAATTSGGAMTWAWERQEPGGGSFATVGTSAGTYTTPTLDCATDHGANYRFTVTDTNGDTVSDVVGLTVRSVTTVARPVADVTTTDWTTSAGTDFFALIDEAVASDADYIDSPTLTGTAQWLTADLDYPLAAGDRTVSVRASVPSGTGTLKVRLENDAAAVVGTAADQAVTGTPTTYDLDITLSAPATRISFAFVS